MLVKDLMMRVPAFCTRDTTVDKAAELMLRNDCGEIPVCDDERVVGVITDRDIACRVVAARKNPLRTTVSEFMSSPAITVSPEDEIELVVETMRERQIRRLPVTSSSGKLVGMIAQADLASKLPTDLVGRLLKSISRPATVYA